jgi:hypothetical protein
VSCIAHVINEELFPGSSNNSSLLQMLEAASSTQVASLWRVLFVFLAWTVGAERRSSAGLTSARPLAAREAAKQAMAAVPCYHQELLAAVGAPPAHEVGAYSAITANMIAQLWQMVVQQKVSASISTANSNNNSHGGSSSNRSSSSNSTGVAAAQPQLLQQLVAAVPCRQALLLVLEAALLQLYTQELTSITLQVMGNLMTLTCCMLGCVQQQSGAAASAEAASVLLPALVQLMPQAVLHAAAAAGCEGLRPNADEYVSAMVQALHGNYARLVALVPFCAGQSE